MLLFVVCLPACLLACFFSSVERDSFLSIPIVWLLLYLLLAGWHKQACPRRTIASSSSSFNVDGCHYCAALSISRSFFCCRLRCLFPINSHTRSPLNSDAHCDVPVAASWRTIPFIVLWPICIHLLMAITRTGCTIVTNHHHCCLSGQCMRQWGSHKCIFVRWIGDYVQQQHQRPFVILFFQRLLYAPVVKIRERA